MKISHTMLDTQKAPAESFTGNVYINAVTDPAHTPSVALVHFTPGARTRWHAHPHGETIFVTEGVGLCQCEGHSVEELHPGTRVRFEPGERHWHGAATDNFMMHIAIEQLDEPGRTANCGEPAAS